MIDFKKKDLVRILNVYQNHINEFINIGIDDIDKMYLEIAKKDLEGTTIIHKEQCWNCKEDVEYTDLHAFCPKCLTSM